MYEQQLSAEMDRGFAEFCDRVAVHELASVTGLPLSTLRALYRAAWLDGANWQQKHDNAELEALLKGATE